MHDSKSRIMIYESKRRQSYKNMSIGLSSTERKIKITG